MQQTLNLLTARKASFYEYQRMSLFVKHFTIPKLDHGLSHLRP